MKEMEGCSNCRWFVKGLCARTTPRKPHPNGWCSNWMMRKPDRKMVPYLIRFVSDKGEPRERRIYTDGTSDDIIGVREEIRRELENSGGAWRCLGAKPIGGDINAKR